MHLRTSEAGLIYFAEGSSNKPSVESIDKASELDDELF